MPLTVVGREGSRGEGELRAGGHIQRELLGGQCIVQGDGTMARMDMRAAVIKWKVQGTFWKEHTRTPWCSVAAHGALWTWCTASELSQTLGSSPPSNPWLPEGLEHQRKLTGCFSCGPPLPLLFLLRLQVCRQQHYSPLLDQETGNLGFLCLPLFLCIPISLTSLLGM